MHGCCSGSTFLVNAEVDSMGGVVDGVIGIGTKPSPRRAAIEKAQAELRQEYDVREERIRELEFLEKGGDPLDFKLGPTASVSVQSTSLTDQHPQIVTSEAKGSFPLVASPRGDSAESSGRPGGPIACEANSADNLLLFDGENQLPEGERQSKIPSVRSNATLSLRLSDPVQNVKEVEDSAIFRPYARRNRTRSNRDGARSTSNDVNSSRSTQGSLPTRHGFTLRDAKGSVSETNNQKDQQIVPISNPKEAAMNGNAVCNVDNHLNIELNGAAVQEASTASVKDGLQEGNSPLIPSTDLPNLQQKQAPVADSKQSTGYPFSGDSDIVKTEEQAVSAGAECIRSATADEIASGTVANEDNQNRERHVSESEGESGRVAVPKNIDLDSDISKEIPTVGGNSDKDLRTDSGDMDHTGNSMERTLVSGVIQDIAGRDILKMNELNSDVRGTSVIRNDSCTHLNNNKSVSEVKVEKETNESILQKEANAIVAEGKSNDVDESDQKQVAVFNDTSSFGKGDMGQVTMETSVEEIPDGRISREDGIDVPSVQSFNNNMKESNKEREDSILAEARIIEAKRKRISELSVATFSFENRQKSHWDFVLEEMSWLANDFVQERIWKITMGAHISRKVAVASHLRLHDQLPLRNQQKIACTLAKAVMQFWHSAELLLDRDSPEYHKHEAVNSGRVNDSEGATGRIGQPKMEANKGLKLQHQTQKIKDYAVRFLEYNRSRVPSVETETSLTPEILSDPIVEELPWVEHLTEENLFYTVAAGAMESYRRSIESYLKTGSNMQEEVDTSMHDAFEELSQENAYDEDEGETSTYYLPGAFEGSKASKFAQNKNIRSYSSRPYDSVADSAYGQCEVGSRQSGFMRKRTASDLNIVSIPTKRMRTAPRPRMLSPFGAAVTGNAQASFKTDASSGDTNSLQDDQSTLNGGSQVQNSMEVDSTLEFDKQFPYDSGEISTKPKKKKKPKHLNTTYDQRWQLGSTVPNEQRDQYKKRLESPHFESNGCNGVFGQHSAKKPKIMKQSLDVSFDNMTPVNGPMPSPVASQMSNMSNSNKFLKMIGGRDRGKKTKGLKAPHGHAGSGSAWTQFEDQALVVLVHDLGPNWELISDAINSTLQFTCIFRKPRECRERHNILMDRNAGDGADSAEDSGSSQPYPSTLPGIPKGSARQLFQRLQGPVEEDTLKTHFEKIIIIGQKQHCRRTQLDNQDMKPIPAHKSHGDALALVCPNNLNGSIQTPLDLCEPTALSHDVLPLGYQGSQSSGFPNQGSVQTMFANSGPNSSLQGSAGMVLGNNLASPSGPLNAPVRDGRYVVPRLPVDEQQRQHYNPMLPNRNIQPNMVASGPLSGNERGTGRMLSGGNGIGMMSGMNSRGMPMSRPGFQGMTSSSMLNSANMISSTMGVPTPVNIAGSGQANSLSRPRDAVTQMRPGHTPVVPEVQMQVAQGNTQVVPPFNGYNPNFSSQTGSTPGQAYSVHPQHQHQVTPQQSHLLSNSHHPHLQGSNHAMGPQHPAYAHRLAKERQLQHQRMMQQQQQFSASNGLIAQPQSLQSNSLNQPQSSQPPVLSPSSPTPVPSQLQQKHHLAGHGISRNHQLGLAKQRQRPQQQQQSLQQSGRPNHLQQRQMPQSQQHGKLMKGNGRGNTSMNSNISVDPAHLNGVSVSPPGSQATEKGDQVMPMTQGQSLHQGPNLNTHIPASQSSGQVQNQSKHFSSPPLAKQVKSVNLLPNNNGQGQVPSVPASHASTVPPHQIALPLPINSNHHQLPLQPQLQQNQVDQTQVNIQKSVQQNRPVTQAEQSKFGQDAVNSSPRSDAALSTCVEPTNQAPAISSLGIPRWKGPESLSDSGGQIPHSPIGTVGSPPPIASGVDSVQLKGQGEVQGQLSGSLPSHDSGQWQQHTHVKQSGVLVGAHQQQLESPKQQQSLQPIQHQQAGKSNMYIGPANS